MRMYTIFPMTKRFPADLLNTLLITILKKYSPFYNTILFIFMPLPLDVKTVTAVCT